MPNLRFSFTALVLLLFPQIAPASDWPCWRGPHHDGVSTESNWLAKWPADGLPVLWKTNVGAGYSAVAVAGRRLYTAGYAENNDTVFCFDAETGRVVWKLKHLCFVTVQTHEGDGTVSTPAVDGRQVYFFARNGDLLCIDAATGLEKWHDNAAENLGAKAPLWGYGASPLVQGDLVVLNVGTAGEAFNKKTGKLVWSTGKKEAGYSTPVLYFPDGKPAFALMTGAVRWERAWKATYDLNIADPIPVDDKVFVSAFYGEMCALLDKSGNTVWQNSSLRSQFCGPILVGGFLYGVDGKVAGGDAGATALTCMDVRDGSAKWRYGEITVGAFTVAGGKFIAISDAGELFTGDVSPLGFKLVSQAQVLGGQCLTPPVLANGRIYCRNAKGDLVCLDALPRQGR
jgi:outer membrane protein assembly factor BamB